MDKQEFAVRFELAANFCRDFTQSLIIEELPKSLRFNFGMAERLPVNAKGRVKFIGGRLLKPEQLKGLEKAKAGQLLWVDGKIPVWINLRVDYFDENHTCIEILFNAQRLTDNHERLMHEREGNPPFHVLGPPGGKSGETIHFQHDK
jgi:hypothetical protein